ncbi:MAG: DUF4145 domain-containing protein [Candidatus Moraniibacteriota bacterium]
MTKVPYKAPEFKNTSFNCPFCNAFAKQSWYDLYYLLSGYRNIDDGNVCFCSHCGMYSIWYNGSMIYPNFAGIESPNQDLDEDIQKDYQEAAEILQKSPRGATALLRLSIQKLCIQLGEKGKDINTDIGNLVKKGLPAKVQESLDALRVIGNEAVHPGEMDLRDDTEIASSLFRLVNFIAEKMITEPREIEEIYNKIPESKKEQISQRDGNKINE